MVRCGCVLFRKVRDRCPRLMAAGRVLLAPPGALHSSPHPLFPRGGLSAAFLYRSLLAGWPGRAVVWGQGMRCLWGTKCDLGRRAGVQACFQRAILCTWSGGWTSAFGADRVFSS